MDLFAHADRYHAAPASGRTDTSRAAASKVSRARKEIWNVILNTLEQHGPKTGSEIAEILGRDLLFLRPRLTELGPKGTREIADTGERRKNAKGNTEICWGLA